MQVFEVSLPEQEMVKRMFGGFVFRRQSPEGRCYIKISKGQKVTIAAYLPTALRIPRPDLYNQ